MRLANIALALLLLGINSETLAGTCFCLIDDDDNLRSNCSELRQGSNSVILCRAEDGSPVTVTDLTAWTRVADGSGRCKPCSGRLPGIDDEPIRGDTEK